MTTPTVAILGSGRMAATRAEALRAADPRLRLVVCSRSRQRAAALASACGAEALDADTDLGQLGIDAVLVCSATVHHQADTERALGLGVPVLCEKPLSLSVDSARLMTERAEAAGVSLFVAFHRRFDPAYGALRARMIAGEVGTIYHLRTVSFDVRPSTPDFIAGSGGIFRDLLVHDIDATMWTTGCEVASVHATGAVRYWPDYAEGDDFDVATVLLTMSDGLVATVHGSRHCPLGQDVRTEVLGSHGSLSAGLGPHTPVQAVEADQIFAGSGYQSFQQRWAEAFASETVAFLRSVVDGTAFDGASAREALAVQVVAEACVSSADTGRAVHLSPT